MTRVDPGGVRPDDRADPFEFTFTTVDAAPKHVLADHGTDLGRAWWLKPLGNKFQFRHDADEITHMISDEYRPRRGPEKILLRVPPTSPGRGLGRP